MTRIEIVDDCMPYRKTINLKYAGPDSYKISKAIWEDIKPFFQVSTSGVSFHQLNWDDSSDPIEFFLRWWMKKRYSRFTYIWLKMKCVGTKKKADGSGTFSVSIRSFNTTSYSTWLPGPIAKFFWAIYSYLFYNKARQNMLKVCQDTTMAYKDHVMKKFKLNTLPYEKPYDGYFGP